MRRLSSYIGRQVFFGISIVLLLIAGLDFLVNFEDELGAVKGQYTLTEVLIYTALTAPRRIVDFVPYAALIGCLVGLGSLAASGEILVIRSAGVSTTRCVWMAMRPTLLFILLALLATEYISPLGEQLAQSRKATLRNVDNYLVSDDGVWHKDGNDYMHIGVVQSGGVLLGLSVFNFAKDGRLERVVYADRAIYLESKVWVLESGSVLNYAPNGGSKQNFTTRDWQTSLTPKLLNTIVLQPRQLSTTDLWRFISYRDAQGLQTEDFKLSFWRKVLQPLTTISLVLIAISFVFGPLRQMAMAQRLFIGVATGVAFSMVQNMLGPASLVYGFNPLISVLLPIVIVCIIGMYLLRRV